LLSFSYDRGRVKEELDMCVTDIKYDQVISNDSLSYYFKMQDAREDAREEGMIEGIEKGIEKGIAKGRAEERFFMARSFRNMGFPLDKIAEATGLSEDEIKGL